uniref:Pseudouridine-5'-monophosphatase n=1 Tax=Rhabditophanes sp. KR3021 TaxID=114890 RepID=A0AC35TIR3_9BILA
MLFRPKITHVIFDLDGTLIDSETIYTLANVEALEKNGVDGKLFTIDVKMGMTGKTQIEAVPWLLKRINVSDKVNIDKYFEDYNGALQRLLPTCTLLPGALKVIEYFGKLGIPMSICTGSNTFEYELKTKNLQHLFKDFEAIVLAGSDPEVTFGKPDPCAFIVTINRFKTLPSNPLNVLVFEDAPNGVHAAVAARCQVVMVPQFDSSSVQHAKTKATAVYETLDLFEPKHFDLPPF